MKDLLELRTLPCYLSWGPFHILNIRNSEPGKQIEQTDLWAIKNNSLLKYFQSPRWGLPCCWWWDVSSLWSAPAVTTQTSWSGQSSTCSQPMSSRDLVTWHTMDQSGSLIHISRQEHPPGQRYDYNNKFQYNDSDTDRNCNRNWRFLWGFLNNPVFLPHTKCLKNKKIS